MRDPIRLAIAAGSLGCRVGRWYARAAGAWLDLRRAQYWPPRPHTIQFPVNDICNSRCSMCNIWQRKRDHEITAEELAQVLSDSLFREVTFVGLSGGEPTLRRDLDRIGHVLCRELPKLEALHLITNAIQADHVVNRIAALNGVARAASKRFAVSVSLDGVGHDHDRNRGVPGNFDAAVTVIDTLRKNNIPVSIGCTLTPINAYAADDLLEWAERQNLDFEFRLGVEIKRVYNDGYNLLNPLSPQQRFHLTMFFDKLTRHPRVTAAHQQFYRSLVDQLAFDSPRAAGCHWQTRGITLDTRGNLSYCSVKSPILESAIGRSAWRIYRRHIAARRQIVNRDCSTCRHDLLGPPTPHDHLRRAHDELLHPFRLRLRLRRARRMQENPETLLPTPRSIRPAARPLPSQWRRVLITGWYGTETAGDKAILGELIHFLRTHSPGSDIILTTIDRKVSQQTASEMRELAGVELIDLNRASACGVVSRVDAVIVGGGPLEQVAEMADVWRIFKRANALGKARILFGCGVGPFHTREFRNYAAAILRWTTAGFVRDRPSHQLAGELGAPGHLGVACDPALRYVSRWRKRNAVQPHAGLRVAGLLRANTSEYVADLTPADLDECNRITADQLAQIIGSAAAGHHAAIDLLPMHAIPLGGDDRLFNRKVAQACRTHDPVQVERGYLTLDQLLGRLASCDAAVAMRYHGHLFCMALGVPMLSIDYTGERGKVAALIDRIGYREHGEDWRTMDPARATGKLDRVLRRRDLLREQLLAATALLVARLERVYTEVFAVHEAHEAHDDSFTQLRAAA